jgi:hypothetical protein
MRVDEAILYSFYDDGTYHCSNWPDGRYWEFKITPDDVKFYTSTGFIGSFEQRKHQVIRDAYEAAIIRLFEEAATGE